MQIDLFVHILCVTNLNYSLQLLLKSAWIQISPYLFSKCYWSYCEEFIHACISLILFFTDLLHFFSNQYDVQSGRKDLSLLQFHHNLSTCNTIHSILCRFGKNNNESKLTVYFNIAVHTPVLWMAHQKKHLQRSSKIITS